MNPLKLLIIEDDQQDMRVYKDTIHTYTEQKNRQIDLIECPSSDTINQRLNNSFDAAVIDIRIEKDDTKGTRIIQEMENSFFRIPLAVITGTPDHFDLRLPNVTLYKKGEVLFPEVLDRFFDLYNTGLTNIIGGRGKIAQTLKTVFDKHLLPHQEAWISYGKSDPKKTEEALLRYTLNHLLELLNEDENLCFPEEVYIYPPLSEKIKTGSIVRCKEVASSNYVVLNPACDLVLRKGCTPKTDSILLATIESESEIFPSAFGTAKQNKYEDIIKRVLKNNHTDYLHWLPKTEYFPGGFINFRKIISWKIDEFYKHFNLPQIQISPFFVKDIISRFSSYYARQGQPDIDNENLTKTYLQQHLGSDSPRAAAQAAQ